MIQQMLAIWSLVPLPFLKPAWTSGSSQFTYCWSLAWRILSITLLVCAAAAKLLQLCLTRRPHRWQPMRLSRPWDSPGKNTRVGCHCLLRIPVELFQILKDDAVKVLHSICQQIWKTQQWPQDWKRSVFIPIPRKGNVKECSNYRTIALISHASKVILKILQARL